MNINSTQGLFLKGYNAANSGNAGVRTFGAAKNLGASSGFQNLIRFSFNETAVNVGLALSSYFMLTSTNSNSNSWFFLERATAGTFNGTNINTGGAYDYDVGLVNYNGAFNCRILLSSGAGNTKFEAQARGDSEPISASVNVYAFCTDWSRITVTYP